MVQRRRRRRPIPSTAGYPVELRSIYDGELVTVRALSESHGGVLTHFSRHSQVCHGDQCPPALHRLKTTWYGFEPVEEWDGALKLWLPCVLQVTEHLEMAFRRRYRRGTVWELSRAAAGKGRHGPVEGKFIAEEDPHQWPKAFSMDAVLFNVFREVPRLDLASPMADQLFLQPSPAAPPATAQQPPPSNSAEERVPFGELLKRRRQQQPSENGESN